MRKILLTVLTTVVAFTAAGCGGASKPDAKTAAASQQTVSQSPAAGPVEIELWIPYKGTNAKTVEDMVNKFNESQKEVVVKPSFQGDYYENHSKVLASIPAGTQPDVTMIELASLGAFAEPGALEDLSPYIKKDNVDLNDFLPGLMKNTAYEGKQVSLPFFRSTPLMVFNVDMLKSAGLDPKGPKTWEELREYARKLSIKDKRWGFTSPIDIWFYEALTFQSGGGIMTDDGKKILFNSKEGAAPVKFWKDMINEEIMKFPSGEKYNAWTVAETDFFNQQAGIMFMSTGGLAGAIEKVKGKFELGAAFLPAGEKGFGVPTGGANIVILSKSKKKEAAWKFVKWVTDTQQSADGSIKTGYMPTRNSASQLPEMQKLYQEKPQFKVAFDQLQYAQPRPMAPAYKEMQEMIMTELQRAVIDDSVTAEQAIDNAAKKGEKLLKK